MNTLKKLKSAIDHLERMEFNTTHFYAMGAVCRPELVDKMNKHLQHAISGAKQDIANIVELANKLQKETS